MLWIHPASLMQFKYHGSRQPRINKAWLAALTFAANQIGGLYLVPNPPRDRRIRS
ncbi:DUF7882 family protein [Microbacterium jiangjiandongii]|uniref:DUF7882 family protein n=1 Tax=Microbacterium jiangjiandongii TaxID=3049071 RepID=UPI004044DDE8